MPKLEFQVIYHEGTKTLPVEVEHLYIAGFAGRDINATMAHIEELAEMGVPRPASIPSYYDNGTNLLVQDGKIQVVGKGSSGEVEFVVLRHAGELYVGIGSDHTDRDLESVDVPKAKQVCPKPVGKTLWKYEEVKDHWDELTMESWQVFDGETVLYQSGKAESLLPIETVAEGIWKERGADLTNAVMFCGTVAAIGGIRGGSRFIGKVTDHKLGRSLDFAYDVEVISE